MKEHVTVSLIDRLLAEASVFDASYAPAVKTDGSQFLPKLLESEKFDCTNTSDLWWSQPGADKKWGIHGLFNVRPPFDNLWIEIDNAKVPRDPTTDFHPARSGVHLLTSGPMKPEQCQILMGAAGVDDSDFVIPMDGVDSVHIITASVFQLYRLAPDSIFVVRGLCGRNMCQFNGMGLLAITSDGKPCSRLGVQPLSVEPSVITAQNRDFLRQQGQHHSAVIANEIFCALFGVQFAHCKNVRVCKSEPPKAYDKTYKKRYGRPLVRFHTLEIDAMKEVLRNEGGMERNGLRKALHLCRGHFATYTEDNPLFGRITGTFWKPAHVRGNASEGIVAKDYRVKAPAIGATA